MQHSSWASACCAPINQNYILQHYTRHTHMLQQMKQLFIYKHCKYITHMKTFSLRMFHKGHYVNAP